MEANLCVRNNSYLIFVLNFQKNEPERRSGLKKKNRNAVPERSGPIRTLLQCLQDVYNITVDTMPFGVLMSSAAELYCSCTYCVILLFVKPCWIIIVSAFALLFSHTAWHGKPAVTYGAGPSIFTVPGPTNL